MKTDKYMFKGFEANAILFDKDNYPIIRAWLEGQDWRRTGYKPVFRHDGFKRWIELPIPEGNMRADFGMMIYTDHAGVFRCMEKSAFDMLFEPIGQIIEASAEDIVDVEEDVVEEEIDEEDLLELPEEELEVDTGSEINATDAAKKLAEEEGIELSDVVGTGKDGSILKSDVEKLMD